MSIKYIKKRIEQNFVYPNNDRKLYDTEIVHDINDNCVSGDINTFSATTVAQTGITIQYSFDWDANGAELFQMDNGNYSYISVHMMTPDQSFLKPFRVVLNVESPTLYTGTTTFTGTTTILPQFVGVNSFVNGDYYYEVRFIGHRCIYPICGSLDITTLPGPTPTPTPTSTPTPTPTLCSCVDYTLTNTGITAFLVSYQECPYGETVINFVAQTGQSYNFCACDGSVGYEGGSPAQLVNNGPCAATPTPTSTPTPTIECECWNFTNDGGAGPINIYWDDCVNGPSSESLNFGGSVSKCVVNGTTPTSDAGGTVTPCYVPCTTTCLPCL